MINYPVGTHVFAIPVRFWEEPFGPEEYQVIEENEGKPDVYLKDIESTFKTSFNKDWVFYRKESAVQAIGLKLAMRLLRDYDECELDIHRIYSKGD